jgi:glucokinase
VKDKKQYVIGFDLGGTKILATLFDRRFRLVTEIKTRSKPQKGEKHFLNTLAECYETLLQQGRVHRSEIVGIGMGCPGLIDEKKGVVLASPNIAFMKNFRLADKIQKVTRLPVVLGNDVNIGLFGEHQFGAAKGYSQVVGIFIGTGIGGALIIDGRLYAGATGGAGEIGHMAVDPLGPLCGCGRRGCFEALCSRLAIATEAATLAARQQAPRLFDIAGTDILDIKSGQLAQAIRRGDKAVAELIRRKSQTIGLVMGNVVNLLNPELIVLGGGLVEAMPHLILKEATQAMQNQAMPGLARQVKVATARLGDRAIVMGAAKRAWDKFGGKN